MGQAGDHSEGCRFYLGAGLVEIKVVEPQATETNTEAINRLHDEIWASFGRVVHDAIPKAIGIGERLTWQKDELKHGEWEAWIETNVVFNTRQAWKYMKIHERRDEIANLHSGGDLTINKAVALLVGPQSTGDMHVSTGEVEWYTPPDIVEAIRDVMGTIDLDPASSPLAQETVKAGRYYVEEDSGQNREWKGNVFMNPPYSRPAVEQFVDRAVRAITSSEITQFIGLTNNATDTDWFHSLCGACGLVCIPNGRLKFYNNSNETLGARQGQALFYWGKNEKSFIDRFSDIGLMLRVV